MSQMSLANLQQVGWRVHLLQDAYLEFGFKPALGVTKIGLATNLTK